MLGERETVEGTLAHTTVWARALDKDEQMPEEKGKGATERKGHRTPPPGITHHEGDASQIERPLTGSAQHLQLHKRAKSMIYEIFPSVSLALSWCQEIFLMYATNFFHVFRFFPAPRIWLPSCGLTLDMPCRSS